MVYELSRTAILMFQISPMIPLEYGGRFPQDRHRDRFERDGSDRRQRPLERRETVERRSDVSPEGRGARTFMGRIREPGEELEDEYTGDLDHKETTVDVETALKHIWRGDNIAEADGSTTAGHGHISGGIMKLDNRQLIGTRMRASEIKRIRRKLDEEYGRIVEGVCPVCGTPIRKPRRGPTAKFCSERCRRHIPGENRLCLDSKKQDMNLTLKQLRQSRGLQDASR